MQASYHPPISSTSIEHVWPGMSFNASTFEFETLLGSILLVASDSHCLLLDWGFCEFKKISRLMKSFGYVVSHGAETRQLCFDKYIWERKMIHPFVQHFVITGFHSTFHGIDSNIYVSP